MDVSQEDNCAEMAPGGRFVGHWLSSLRELVDPSQILFGSDYPFASEFIVDIMVKGLQSFDGFGAGELVEIERGNAVRVFPRYST